MHPIERFCVIEEYKGAFPIPSRLVYIGDGFYGEAYVFSDAPQGLEPDLRLVHNMMYDGSDALCDCPCKDFVLGGRHRYGSVSGRVRSIPFALEDWG